MKPKRELIRLVRTPTQSIEVDIGSKQAGRGAYLCPVAGCWEIALKGNRLEHSLRVRITPDNIRQLVRLGQDLFQDSSQIKDSLKGAL